MFLRWRTLVYVPLLRYDTREEGEKKADQNHQSRSGYACGRIAGHQQRQQPETEAGGDNASGSRVPAGT